VGWTAQRIGVSATALLIGLVCLGVIGTIHVRYPVVRRLTGVGITAANRA
jgi:hypothetical protein